MRKTSGRRGALNRASELIRESSSLYLASHIRPDGDAIGSLLGLALALESSGRRVAALLADPVPPNYRFLPGAERIRHRPPDWRADLGIVVDCDGLSRLGPLEPAFSSLPHLVDIDHHRTDRVFGEVQIIDPGAAASGEIVYHLLRRLDLPLDAEIAACLYSAILTDTGRFCFGNTSAGALRVAADLVKAGARPQPIARSIYEERSVAATHLLGLALSRLSSELDGQAVSSTLTRQDFLATGAAPSDTEGIIDHLRAIGGPRVALLFVQPDHNGVRVSLRSDGSVDVSEIALQFGGGGHAMAAGCTVAGAADEVRKRILVSLAGALPTAETGRDA
jgi:phosphoesterase RecJ-like protein